MDPRFIFLGQGEIKEGESRARIQVDTDRTFSMLHLFFSPEAKTRAECEIELGNEGEMVHAGITPPDGIFGPFPSQRLAIPLNRVPTQDVIVFLYGEPITTVTQN